MKINYEFACQDDCLDKMVPSDLRQLVCERDQAYRNIDILKSELEANKEIASECYNKLEDALFDLETLRTENKLLSGIVSNLCKLCESSED